MNDFLNKTSQNNKRSSFQARIDELPKPRLLDQVREVIRLKHYSIRTEQTYIDWIKRYIYFHDKKHPKDMGAEHITAFLTHLAVKLNVPK